MFATQRNLSNFYTFRRDAGILGILHHSNQRLQLLRSESFKFLQNVCIIIQLQESGVELHLLGKRKGIDIAVGDIAIHRVVHTLRYVVMKNVSKFITSIPSNTERAQIHFDCRFGYTICTQGITPLLDISCSNSETFISPRYFTNEFLSAR